MQDGSWKKRHVQRTCSRCLARGEYSIDQPQRLWKSLLAQRDLAVRDRVDRGGDAVAERAQLAGPEHELADAGAAPAEDEVISAEASQLQLRLLDEEEVLDRLGQRAVPVLRRDLE